MNRVTLCPFAPIIFLALRFAHFSIASEFEDRVLPIIRAQCLACHDSQSKEGGFNLERFASFDGAMTDRAAWKRLFDVVEAGQMPLRDSGYTLTSDERITLLDFVRELQSQPEPRLKAIDPGKPILRRLTRLEYNNSVRDLFGLSYDIFMFPERLPIADKRYFVASKQSLGSAVQTSMREYGQKFDVLLPQLGLPGDNRAEYGFANRGDSLNTSPLLLEKYLQLAAAISQSDPLHRESTVMQSLLGMRPKSEPSKPPPESNNVARPSINFATNNNVAETAESNDVLRSTFVTELTDAFERGSGGVFDVPDSLNNQTIAGKGGLIRIAVGTNGETLTINPNADLWLAAFGTANETSGQHLLTNRIKGEKTFELTFGMESGEAASIKQLGVCVLARRGQRGPVVLTAVLSDMRELSRTAEISDDSGNVFYSFAAPQGTSIKRLRVDGSQFTGDYVLLDDIGFIRDQSNNKFLNRESPPLTNAVLESSSPKTIEAIVPLPNQTLQVRVQQFLNRAYRRDVSDTELSSALEFVSQSQGDTASEATALRRLVQSVLVSPEFLFIDESVQNDQPSVRKLNDFELANRLSYFFWASMPDEELLELARNQRLGEADTLRSQVRRMLANRSRSRELSESFAVQWLRLDQLYTAKPDEKLFKAFYSGPQGKSTLHASMMTEALLLFETVLVEDRSILDFIDADFTWLNQQLARLYQLNEVYESAVAESKSSGDIPSETDSKNLGGYWFRSKLPDRSRGGVITMAGPLTLTSLPFRTSPIKRGAWLLETVFNRPPAEPKVAFVLDDKPTNAGADLSHLTIRQRFEQHRTDPNCYSCHSRIDPPGFSLESFDAIGAWREKDGSQDVDSSGIWNTHAFRGPAEFKDALRKNDNEFVRGFVEHMLSYALGRPLEHFDMPAIDRIVNQSQLDKYRLSRILEEVVLSYPFQYVRNGE